MYKDCMYKECMCKEYKITSQRTQGHLPELLALQLLVLVVRQELSQPVGGDLGRLALVVPAVVGDVQQDQLRPRCHSLSAFAKMTSQMTSVWVRQNYVCLDTPN